MTSTTLLSDVVFPAATWYEKHDLSSTDMHPFVHAFTPAIDPPWEAKSDFDLFHAIAEEFSEMAGRTSAPAGTSSRCRSSTTPRARPRSRAASSATGRAATSRRAGQDDAAVHRRRTRLHRDRRQAGSVGPLADTLGFTIKNVTFRHEDRPAGAQTA